MASQVVKAMFCDRHLERSRAVRARLRAQGMSVRATSYPRLLLGWIALERPDLVVLGNLGGEFTPELLVGLVRSRWGDVPTALLVPDARPEEAARLRDDLAVPYVAVAPVPDDILTAALTSVAHGRRPSAMASWNGMVLCVDDDPLYLSSLTRLLRRSGDRVAAYESPEQALEALPMVRPDLAILDVAMAGMTGLQMTEEIRELHGRRLPIVLLSGLDTEREIRQGYRSGANTYLTKQCEPSAVLTAVRDLLGETGRNGGRPGS